MVTISKQSNWKHFLMRDISWQTSQRSNTIFMPYYAQCVNFKNTFTRVFRKKSTLFPWDVKSWYLLRFFLAASRNLWDLSSLTRDQTRAPWSGSVESFNHRTAREVPFWDFLGKYLILHMKNPPATEYIHVWCCLHYG